MKAIIMAAGVGSRLKKRLGNMPKCCTVVGNETLIQRMLRLLAEKGIQDVVLALGYRNEVVREQLQGHSGVRCYINPFFNITNSIASLWFAQDELDGNDEVVLINGDLFFESRLLDQVMDCQQDVAMFADPRRVQEADYRFSYENGLLRRYGKDLTVEETTGEYVGIAKLRKTAISGFLSQMNAMIQAQKQSLWWEDVIYELSSKGMPVHICEITDCFWAELDYIEDYERVQEYLRIGGHRIRSTQVLPVLAWR